MPATVGVCRCGHPHEHLGDRPGRCARGACGCTTFRPPETICQCGHPLARHQAEPSGIGTCVESGCRCTAFRPRPTPEYRDPGPTPSAEAGPLCPACGDDARAARFVDPVASLIEDSEGYRWHHQCVVDILSSVRRLVQKKTGLDIGRK